MVMTPNAESEDFYVDSLLRIVNHPRPLADPLEEAKRGQIKELLVEYLQGEVDIPTFLTYLSGVHFRLVVTVRGDGVLESHFEPLAPTWHGYGLWLLLDPTRPYAAALSRCQYVGCGALYLARKHPKGGPPNKIYCSAAHRNAAH